MDCKDPESVYVNLLLRYIYESMRSSFMTTTTTTSRVNLVNRLRSLLVDSRSRKTHRATGPRCVKRDAIETRLSLIYRQRRGEAGHFFHFHRLVSLSLSVYFLSLTLSSTLPLPITSTSRSARSQLVPTIHLAYPYVFAYVFAHLREQQIFLRKNPQNKEHRGGDGAGTKRDNDQSDIDAMSASTNLA